MQKREMGEKIDERWDLKHLSGCLDTLLFAVTIREKKDVWMEQDTSNAPHTGGTVRVGSRKTEG